MTIGNLLYRLTADTKKLVRNIETTSKKHIKCIYAQVFNKTCISENVLPNYSNIYIYIYIYIYNI